MAASHAEPMDHAEDESRKQATWDFPGGQGGEAGPSTPPIAGGSGSGTAERPTDEEILMQQNRIRAEEAQKHEYVGPIEPINALKEEYVNGNEVFVAKIDKLAESYTTFRRTRGDGNCFFRGLAFSYLENLLEKRDISECHRLAGCVQEWKQKLIDGGFQELVFEDAMDLLLDQIKAVQQPHTADAHDKLTVDMRDDTVSNMIVMFLRLVTSCEVQRREDFFFPFILGMYDEPPATVDLFCQRHVQPMGEESDHLHIVAITDALQVPVRIVYLDRSGAMGAAPSDLEVTTHDFVPDSCPQGTVPRVHLLYRPGHYDILYTK